MRHVVRVLAITLLLAAGRPAVAGPPNPEAAVFEETVSKALQPAKPAARGAGARAGAAKAAGPALAYDEGNAGGGLGDVEMRRANRAAAEILKARMEKNRPSDLLLIRQAVGADVVVIQGSYDRVQDVLRAVDVKHVLIPPAL